MFAFLFPCMIVILTQIVVHNIIAYESLSRIKNTVSGKDEIGVDSSFTDFWVIGPSLPNRGPRFGMICDEHQRIYIYDVKLDEERRAHPWLSIDFTDVTDKERMLKLLDIDVDRRDNLLQIVGLFEPDKYLAKMLVFCYVFNNHDKDSWTEWKGAFSQFDLHELDTVGVDRFIDRMNAMFIFMNSNSGWKAGWYLFKSHMRREVLPFVIMNWFRAKVKMK